MLIFGKNFTTKKEMKNTITKLEDEINVMKSTFPFVLGQTVYDIQLRDENGRYTKENVSLEHSLTNKVVVNKKNYFSLVERYHNKDVFLDEESANAYISHIFELM